MSPGAISHTRASATSVRETRPSTICARTRSTDVSAATANATACSASGFIHDRRQRTLVVETTDTRCDHDVSLFPERATDRQKQLPLKEMVASRHAGSVLAAACAEWRAHSGQSD